MILMLMCSLIKITRYGSYYKSGTTYTLANDIKDYQADLDEAIQTYGKDSLEAKIATNYCRSHRK